MNKSTYEVSGKAYFNQQDLNNLRCRIWTTLNLKGFMTKSDIHMYTIFEKLR